MRLVLINPITLIRFPYSIHLGALTMSPTKIWSNSQPNLSPTYSEYGVYASSTTTHPHTSSQWMRPVQYNMVFKSTIDDRGVKVVAMKSTGHEKVNVSVCLSARADGTKLKPMIVFKDAKQDVNAIHKKMKGKAVVASSSNG